MILYLDTSDLFKLYIQESDSERVDDNVLLADRLASSTLAYVEMRAALAKALGDRRFDRAGSTLAEESYRQLLSEFNRSWRSYVKVSCSQAILRSAGDLAETYALRGGDAVHLAAAVALRAASLDEVRFSVADGRLRAGAVAEGFVVV
jgi:predicted nucleic acid-binding protein